MKYMGSKNRIAKEILPIILKDRKENQYYIEPFVGGANIIDKVDGNKIGADTNRYLIALYKKLQDGWIPPKNVTKEEFLDMKNNPEKYEEHLLGYVGFQLSFGAMWFSSYRRDNQGKRNYSLEAYNNVMKQLKDIKDVIFFWCSYEQIDYPANSIIYCDPPYKDTAGYDAVDSFDHDKFWNWVRNMTNAGHKVFVSEYNAPDDFKCIWEKELSCNISSKYKKNTEKLFVYSRKDGETQ